MTAELIQTIKIPSPRPSLVSSSLRFQFLQTPKKKSSSTISHLLVGVCSVCRSMVSKASEAARVWSAKPSFCFYLFFSPSFFLMSTEFREWTREGLQMATFADYEASAHSVV